MNVDDDSRNGDGNDLSGGNIGARLEGVAGI